MATFEWLAVGPDNRTLLVDSSFIAISSDSSTSQLQLRPLQQSHNGSYSCHATTDEETLSSVPIEISVNCKQITSFDNMYYNIILFVFMQLLRYPFRSLRVPGPMAILFRLQEKIMILFAAYLELKTSILSSLIGGQKTVKALKLEQILTSFHSLQFESLIQGIILAWSLLFLAT